MLTGSGEKKIQVIKVVRELTGLGLKEAKDLVDGAPKAVKEGVTKAEAEEVQEEAGGSGRHGGAEVGSRIRCNLNLAQSGWRQRRGGRAERPGCAAIEGAGHGVDQAGPGACSTFSMARANPAPKRGS